MSVTGEHYVTVAALLVVYSHSSRSVVVSVQMSTHGEVIVSPKAQWTSHSSAVSLSTTTECLVEMHSVSSPAGPDGAQQRH